MSQTLQNLAALVIILGFVGTLAAGGWRLIKRVINDQRIEREKTQAAIAELAAHLEWLEKIVKENDEYVRKFHELSMKTDEAVIMMADAMQSANLADFIDSNQLRDVTAKVEELEKQLTEVTKGFWLPIKRSNQSKKP
jgi:hypothetical protein